jgi:hypothetical protein
VVTKPAATVYPQAAAPSTTASSTSLLDQPPTPAQVLLDARTISVKAENSSLSEILHDISSKTGMTIDGLSKDQRIFGSYGPASTREVLSALLEGVGYNVMMVGDLSNGAPRQLLLTPRGADAAGGKSTAPAMRQNNNNNDDDDDTSDQSDNTPMPPRPNPPEVINQEQHQEPATPPGQNTIKTPQQMLQELQQMRQQQQQQQLQQQTPQP